MANRIQLRRGTSTEWIQFNPVLAEAEFGVEIDTGRFKIGDGATPWQTLKYERPLESTDATPNTLILRDSNSSVKVKNITLSLGGKLFGTATTADKFTTARLIGAASSSDLTGSASFDGSSNLDINLQLKTIFTGDTGLSYTKFNVDSKGRITSAQNPTTLSGYGIVDAQPLNGILTSISTIGTGLGFLTKVETSTSNTSNTIVRSLEVTSGQLTITNASGTAANPILGLSTTTITSGSYNTANLTSTSGDATVNTVKFDVDQYGRLTSATTIPIATASETQKGLASFNSEDFDVSGAGVVTIASQGVDNSQLQNSKIVIGTTDYELGTTYTGFTTISDLTVDTDTLYVDKINHRLGIGTNTPGNFKVDISGTGRISGVLSSTQSGQRPIWSSFGVASTAESGSAPFSVLSTRKVTNLNVDFLDDLTSLDFLRRTDDFNNANNEGNQYIATNFWIDATNVTVQDPIIDIGGGAKGVALTTNDNKDRGLTFQYYSGSSKRAFIGWDNSNGGFAIARDVTVSGEIIQGASTYAELHAGAITLRNGSLTVKTGGTGAGTLAATGETTTFSVDHSTGNTIIQGTLGVTGNVNVNTNKFQIVASSGNTTIAGTLGVTGATTLSSTLGVTGNTTLSGTLGVTGSTTLSSTLAVTDNVTVNTNKFVITASTGNTSIAGTLTVTDNVTLNKNVTIVGSDTAATEFFKIQNGSAVDKFVVDSSSGNTTISGTLGVTGNVNVNTNKFQITASSGNTTIAGTLGVTGATTLSSTLDVTGNVFINTNKFMITASSGNTTIAGTLGVSGNTTLSSDLGVTGNTTLTGNLIANANSTLGDVSTDTLTVNATSTFNAPVTLSGTNTLSVGGDITVSGNLTVNGTTTTINSTTVTVDDKNIELGSIASPTNLTADGGGITLKGTTDKTLNWINANSAWTSSENFDLASGKEYRINNTAVIDSTRNILNIVNITQSGNLTINTNKFTVLGASGNTSIAGTLGVTLATTLSSTLDVTSNATIGGTLGVTGNTTLSGTLGVTNLATFNNGLTISGSTTAATEFLRITDGSITPVTKFLVDSSSGNTTISGTLDVSGNLTIATNKFTVASSTGNTLVAGTLGVTLATTLSSTLNVTDNVTLNKNVTIVGSDTAATEYFKIQNGSAVDKFVVDSSSGNTDIKGTLDILGNVNINTNKFQIVASSGNTTIAGTLSVTDNVTLNKNVTIVGSDTVATELFKIQNASAVDKFVVDSSSGNTTISGTLGVTSATTLSSTLGVSGVTTISNNTDATALGTGALVLSAGGASINNQLRVGGNTNLGGTLGVSGATTLSSTLSVTNDVTLNRNVTIIGSDTAATEFFKIQNASTADKFVVDSSSGNTTISGTLGVTGNTTLSGTLGVTNLATFNNGVVVSGSTSASTEFFRITDSSAVKFEVDSATGNTTIVGTLGVTSATTLSSTLGVTGNFAVNTNKFTVNATSGNTLVAGTLDVTNDLAIATNKFNVASATGNTTIAGTLGVTGLTTLSNGLTISGSTTAATEFLRITDGAATPVTKFLVDSSSGNTTISGTLGVTAATTLSSTLDVTGATTLTGLLNANGGIAVDTTAFTVAGDGTGNTSIAGTLAVTGNTTLTGDLAVNGADITTTATGTATLFNTNATTLNIGGASTTVSIGASTGTTTINNANTVITGDLAVNGGDVTSSSTTFNLLNSTVTTLNIGGAAGTISIGSASSTATFNNNVTVSGNLTVNGTTTTINSTTLSVDDKNIELGSIASPTDTTADGGGITLLGATNKTFNWINSTASWTSSENLELASGKAFRINGASVLNATTLGSGVTASSLTSVGTLTALTVSGATSINNITVASGTSTIATTSTNDLTLTPGGKTVTSKNFDVNATLTVVGQLNADNLRLDGNVLSSTNTNGNITLTPNGVGIVETLADVNFGSSGDLSTLTVIGQLNADNLRLDGNIISSTNTNGNITLTPNGTGVVETVNDVNFGTSGDNSTLTVIGQLNADNLRFDGNTISSTNTNGSVTVTSNGTGTVVLGNVTGGTAITYDSTVTYDTSVSPSNAPIIVHKDVAARGKFVIDGDLYVKGAFAQASGAEITATYISLNGGSSIGGREVTFTSTGIGTSFNLDATTASNGGTFNPSYGCKYLISVQRNSDNARMMLEMLASWDGVVEYYTSAGEIHTTQYALIDPNNLAYTFDVIWVNTGTNGMRATLRISNVPNAESVTVRIGKMMLI